MGSGLLVVRTEVWSRLDMEPMIYIGRFVDMYLLIIWIHYTFNLYDLNRTSLKISKAWSFENPSPPAIGCIWTIIFSPDWRKLTLVSAPDYYFSKQRLFFIFGCLAVVPNRDVVVISISVEILSDAGETSLQQWRTERTTFKISSH